MIYFFLKNHKTVTKINNIHKMLELWWDFISFKKVAIKENLCLKKIVTWAEIGAGEIIVTNISQTEHKLHFSLFTHKAHGMLSRQIKLNSFLHYFTFISTYKAFLLNPWFHHWKMSKKTQHAPAKRIWVRFFGFQEVSMASGRF